MPGRSASTSSATRSRARHAEQNSARLVELLLPRDASTGLPRCRLLRSRARACLPRQTAQSGRARQPPVLIRCTPWATRSAVLGTPAVMCPVVCLAVKPVGEPDAGDRHVRFDERGWETERCRMAQATAPILDSTRLCENVHARRMRRIVFSLFFFRRCLPERFFST